MESLGLLLGHLIGDYIIQNDWMATNKTNPHPGPKPDPTRTSESFETWINKRNKNIEGHTACTTHCLLYTLAVWACSHWWMPWWGPIITYATHWPIDRYRLASWWMKNVAGQTAFATGPLSPWSIIAVDNTIHLTVLYLIGITTIK